MGLLLSVCIACIAFFVSQYIPLGAVTFAILFGMLVNTVFSVSKNPIFTKGITFAEKQILSLAIVLMGVELQFGVVSSLGFSLVFLVVSGVVITITTAIVMARFFSIPPKLALLLGIGNAICGSSAIAGTEKIIEADKKDVGVSIAIVNLLGVIGMFAVPFIGIYIVQYTDIQSGILTGNTLQAVGQAVAGGFSISEDAGEMATIVKMSRVLMLFPLILGLLLYSSFVSFSEKTKETAEKKQFHFPKIPFFIIGFIFFSLCASFQIFSEEIFQCIANGSRYALVLAMSAIGLKISFADITNSGFTVVLFGAFLFFVQIVWSAGVIYFFL